MPINPNQTESQTHVAPPPTPEVLVRTLASDIRAINQGEITPTPEVVSLKSLQATQTEAPPHRSKKIMALVIIAAVLGLLLISYFVLSALTGADNEPIISPSVSPGASVTQ